MEQFINHLSKHKKIYVLILSITLIVFSLVGTSYALLYKEKTFDDINTYSTGNLSISFSGENTISLDSAFPMSDIEGSNLTPYTLTIHNTGNVGYKFDMRLLATEDKNLVDSSYIKIQLNDNQPVTLASINSYLYKDLILDANEDKVINIRIWLDENTPNSQIGKIFKAKIVLDGVGVNSQNKTFVAFLTDKYDNSSHEIYNDNSENKIILDKTNNLLKDASGNIRFFGINPHNYLKIDNDMWRIVGIFDMDDQNGNSVRTIKVIKNESYGNYSFDNISNDWNQASLKEVLNTSELVNSSIIESGYYNLGFSNIDLTSLESYRLEQDINNSLDSWNGLIGLLYPSDSLYSIDYSNCDNNNCQGWLNIPNMWYLTPTEDGKILATDSEGKITKKTVTDLNDVYPVMYLKSNITISEGEGTADNPYIIKSE